MLRRIAMLVILTVLMVSSVWGNESRQEQADQLSKLLGIWEFTIEHENPLSIWYVFDRVHFSEGIPVLLGRNVMTQDKMLIQPTTWNLEGFSQGARKVMSASDFTASSSMYNVEEKEVLCMIYYLKQPEVRNNEPPQTDGHFLGLFTSEEKATETDMPDAECTDFHRKVEAKFTGVKRSK